MATQIHGGRRPLQPKNIIIPSEFIINNPKKLLHVVDSDYSNKENNILVHATSIESMNASLEEELTAVRKKMERLRSDREITEKMLQVRDRIFHFQMIELDQRGEFQKELEIEVDRLYRLKQLKLASMRRSPIRSLRERETEKKKNESLLESAKADRGKEEFVNQSSTSESPNLSSESTSASTSTATSNSTVTSRKSPIPLRLSLEGTSE